MPRLGYAASRIDRAAERRGDAAALAAMQGDDRAGAYVMVGDMIVMRKNPSGNEPLFAPAHARALGEVREVTFLGLMNGAPRFAYSLGPASLETLKSRSELEMTDLRTIAVRALVEDDHLPPLAEGKALMNWHARHRFCSNCGLPTIVVEAGWRRDCPSCEMQHFPRTDPVVIMLATAADRCILGRSGRFVSNSWSCLAGFVEPGETIEEAVRREVREEAGIVCGKVRYLQSQPWPFPSSLMIGCYAQALTQEIVVDRNELEGARWFEREEVAAMLARQHPEGLTTPVPVAIAYHIIRAWVENGVEFE
jgi:NAD+ diphosphatase